ncbi:hypothetical protein ACROYT_G044338 [Oculina patagonica]
MSTNWTERTELGIAQSNHACCERGTCHGLQSTEGSATLESGHKNLDFTDLQKMRDAGVRAERREDREENEDFGDEEDLLDVRMPKECGAKRGGGGKQPGKKKNRGRRGRDKTRFRQS